MKNQKIKKILYTAALIGTAILLVVSVIYFLSIIIRFRADLTETTESLSLQMAGDAASGIDVVLESELARVDAMAEEIRYAGPIWNDAAEEKENLDRLEERAKRKAENKKFWDELAEQYEINRREREAERTAEREAYLDGLAEEANAMNKKLAELDKAIGKRIKEKEAEDEAFDQAMEDAKAAYVSQTKAPVCVKVALKLGDTPFCPAGQKGVSPNILLLYPF